MEDHGLLSFTVLRGFITSMITVLLTLVIFPLKVIIPCDIFSQQAISRTEMTESKGADVHDGI